MSYTKVDFTLYTISAFLAFMGKQLIELLCRLQLSVWDVKVEKNAWKLLGMSEAKG